MMDIEFDKIDKSRLFFYVTLCVIILFFFSKRVIGLNIIFAAALCYYVVSFLNKKAISDDKTHNDILDNKTSLLKPKPENALGYEEFVNYLFSIQDLYIYNPLAYQEMVNEIDTFLDNFEESQKNSAVAGQKYYIMRLNKRRSLNALHSIIHNMPSDINLTHKLNNAMKHLEQILNVYMDKTEQIHNLHIYRFGMNVSTTIIDKGVIARNAFDTNVDYEFVEDNPIFHYDFY